MKIVYYSPHPPPSVHQITLNTSIDAILREPAPPPDGVHSAFGGFIFQNLRSPYDNLVLVYNQSACQLNRKFHLLRRFMLYSYIQHKERCSQPTVNRS
ncbi:hypothetical protein AVEN_88414-1 [Araneus ventricosus]|uniref:Uncharacterized protein n=1 Tax=Araneus ventricosus TaxID=182803 RepID=A0A4Y2UCY8_ARAVE|nr:hypothetical protein AVEN_88414-1 [Araneus ventricosus]